MKKMIHQQLFTGERALFGSHGLSIRYSTFADGESPLDVIFDDPKIHRENTEIQASSQIKREAV